MDPLILASKTGKDLSEQTNSNHLSKGCPGGAEVKNPPADAGEGRDAASIPGAGRSPGGGDGNPLQRSCLESPVDAGAWRAAVHRVAKSRTRLSQAHKHAKIKALFPLGKKLDGGSYYYFVSEPG